MKASPDEYPKQERLERLPIKQNFDLTSTAAGAAAVTALASVRPPGSAEFGVVDGIIYHALGSERHYSYNSKV